jgi:hypothetical protein
MIKNLDVYPRGIQGNRSARFVDPRSEWSRANLAENQRIRLVEWVDNLDHSPFELCDGRFDSESFSSPLD